MSEAVIATSESNRAGTLSEGGSASAEHRQAFVSREYQRQDTVIKVGLHVIGGGTFTVIAGPCSVESLQQLVDTALAVKEAGAAVLRGGVFKPRTSPYSFQGLGEEGLKLLSQVRALIDMPVVTEVMDTAQVSLVEECADVLQIGARNVQNFALLKRVGKSRKPVLLKRGLMTTIEEFLHSAEYILSGGNSQVILCERGIRTFETATRNTLDLSAVCVLKEMTHLPVIVDPSHAVGIRRYVEPLSLAAITVGADGIMVEVHCSPNRALCDGQQSLTPQDFARLMKNLKIIRQATSLLA
mgnify:CR=1 FL=1